MGAEGRWAMRALVAVLAVAAIVLAVWRLEGAAAGVRVEAVTFGTVPGRVYRGEEALGPVLVISHGFAGSQQIMQSFALTAARADGARVFLVGEPGQVGIDGRNRRHHRDVVVPREDRRHDDGGLGERVVQGIPDRSDRGEHAVVVERLRVVDARVLRAAV